MKTLSLLHLPAALILSPLLPAIINRTKAWAAGRKGQPLLQTYYELARLFQKNPVYSRTTSWVFRAGPAVGLAAAVTALVVLPLGAGAAGIHFTGDMIFLVYLLGVMRFFTVAAALDTGSAFEGMGASREVQFAVLAEPALLLSLLAIGKIGETGLAAGLPESLPGLSLSGFYSGLSLTAWMQSGTVLLLAAAALFIVLLAENARIPVDDPNTHLELTMIHEVMVLDHSGPDLGMILYGSAIKLWIFCALLAGILVPVRTGIFLVDAIAVVCGIFLLAVAIGVVESVMARLRMLRVPQLLSAAGALAVLALVLVLKGY